MRRRTTLFTAALAAAASMFVAGPAQAAEEVCVGPRRNVYVCVDPFGSSTPPTCIEIGQDCLYVIVPLPTAECGGDFGQRICEAFSS